MVWSLWSLLLPAGLSQFICLVASIRLYTPQSRNTIGLMLDLLQETANYLPLFFTQTNCVKQNLSSIRCTYNAQLFVIIIKKIKLGDRIDNSSDPEFKTSASFAYVYTDYTQQVVVDSYEERMHAWIRRTYAVNQNVHV